MLDGVTIKLAGRDFTVPPLNLKALRRLAPKLAGLASIGDVPTEADIELVVDAVHTALKRNYPDITVEEVEDSLDLANLRPVLEAVMGASGLKRGAPGEAARPEGSTGPASTDS